MVSFSVLVVVLVVLKGEMLVKFVQQSLMLLSGPRRKLLERKESQYLDESEEESPMATTEKKFAVQEVPQESLSVKDTGFPEPLSPDRNTTLPHPDADTSKNATIEAQDVPLERTHSRRSLLHRRHHSGRSGKITTEDEMRYDNIQYADGTKEKHSVADIEKAVEQRDDVLDVPDDVHEVGSADVSSYPEKDEQGYQDGQRRKGVLRKLNLHKV